MSKQTIQAALEEEAQTVNNVNDLWPALRHQLNNTAIQTQATTLPETSAQARSWRKTSWLLTAAAVLVVLVGLSIIFMVAGGDNSPVNSASTATAIPNSPTYRITIRIMQSSRTDEILNQVKQILEQRLAALGGKAIKVTINNDKTIAVEVSGIKDEVKLNRAIRMQGQLEFIDTGNQLLQPGDFVNTGLCPSGSLYQKGRPTNCFNIGMMSLGIPITEATALAGTPLIKVNDQGQPFQTIITGRELDPTKASIITQTGGQITLNFGVLPKASDTLYNFTSQNIGKNMAIVVDARVISSATIQGAIKDSGTITNGTWTKDNTTGKAEAEELLLLLKSGELPTALNITSFSKS